MAFLRFTRDKRGYEYFYLVQPSQRRGKSAARVLYWFRTPPNIKVGREPFDEAIRRELEAQNPDVSFDWRKILETPIPSADAEKWRERRRAERAARAARGADVQEESAVDEDATSDAPMHVLEAAVEAADSDGNAEGSPDLSPTETSNQDVDRSSDSGPAIATQPELRSVGSGEGSRRTRRRRRRRHGKSGPNGTGGPPPAGPGGDV